MVRQVIKKAISIIVACSIILCNICTSKVISSSGTATGMIFAATGMTSTATYKASEKFIQGKDISFVDATTDIVNVGYAGYIIGNVVSIGATILNEYTGIVDKGIKYFNKKQNTNLSTSMNYADTHSALKTCEHTEISGNGNNQHSLHRPYIRKGTLEVINANTDYNENGQIWDKISRMWVDSDKVELGHRPGNEFWRMREMAEIQNWTQAKFNDYMNNPDFYSWQDIHSNRSHMFEMPR